MQQPFSTFIHMELCDSLCWCLVNDETATHDFILYSPKFHVWKQRFLVNVVGDFKKQKIRLCCLSVSPPFHPPPNLPFFNFARKHKGGAASPLSPVWVCESVPVPESEIRNSLDIVWPGSDLAAVLKRTSSRVGWDLCVGLVRRFLQKCSFSDRSLEQAVGVNQYNSIFFCQIIVFCQNVVF